MEWTACSHIGCINSAPWFFTFPTARVTACHINLSANRIWIRETKTGHTKLFIGLQGFACFSKMGLVSAVLMGYVVDLEGSSRNF